MNVPDFVAIAKSYAPDIVEENKHHLDLVRVGRFISFDMRAADGVDYINTVGKSHESVHDALLEAKARYDADIRSRRVVAAPSRVALGKLMSSYLPNDVLKAQIAEVDNYELLCYIYEKGDWPNDHWDVVCPELANTAKRLRQEQDAINTPTLDPSILYGEPTLVERLAKLLHGVNVQELIAIYQPSEMIAFLEGRFTAEQEDELLHDLWNRVSRDLAQTVVMRRWPSLQLRKEIMALLPSEITQYMNSLDAVDAYMVIRGNIAHDFDNDALTAVIDTAKTTYLVKKKQAKNKGEEKMSKELNIEYHSRLQSTDVELTGTITLSINGELAIVDVSCQNGAQKVTYEWVTMPKHGYDTAVQSMVRWFNDRAAAAIMVVVYPDGGQPKTITVTLDI
jgi:hypothetical protein